MTDNIIPWGWRRDEDRDADEAVRMEQTLLSALINNPACFDTLPVGFGPHHFIGAHHADIFEAAREAAATGAKVITPALRSVLPSIGEVGGYLSQIVAALISCRPNDAKLYAETVMENADRRELLSLTDEVRHAILASEDRQSTVGIVTRAIERLDLIVASQSRSRPAKTLNESMDEAIKAGEDAAERGTWLSGISSGFDCIDNRLGGLEGGGVYVLGARPGVGKSALGLQISMRVARKGHPVLFISLEMQARQFGRRALALASGVGMNALKRGDFARDRHMAELVVRGRQRFADLPMDIEDQPSLTVPAMALRIKAALRRRQTLGLVVVDHLHIVGRPESAGRFGDTQAIAEISRGMKRLAKDFDIPVLLLAQLNREVAKEDRPPCLADLRQSGAIEEDAEAVMFIHRPDMGKSNAKTARRQGESQEDYDARCAQYEAWNRENAGRTELIFDKVRDGERGIETLQFDGQRVRFFEGDDR